MNNLENLKPERVFYYFNEISKIPHGSQNMGDIADFCVDFARAKGLEYIRDDADNVIVFKSPSAGYENSEPIILQGHLDMVCQKTEDCNIDFMKDGLDIYADGDYLKARGTTLGADNGIAVAMILAILEDESLSHPPIEAVFTTDEEIGMIGAAALDCSPLKGKKMINLDSEDDDIMTVSCAGGSDFRVAVNCPREKIKGTGISLTLKGLQGGHSGVEIHKGRVNANILAGRFLNYLKSKQGEVYIISIDGGNKVNAITNSCKITICSQNGEETLGALNHCAQIIKTELAAREPDFECETAVLDAGEFSAFDGSEVVHYLLCAPQGVVEMSGEISNLVETSLNLGILKTDAEKVTFHFSLRSNKMSAKNYLEERLFQLFSHKSENIIESFGNYPAWEFRPNSPLQEIYKRIYKEQTGKAIKLEAIHAGLECGVFSHKIEGLDCISVGPQMKDVHTFKEKLSISSTENIFNVLIKLLESSK